MIVGNQSVQDMMHTLIQKIKETRVVSAPFVIFHGPEHIGKSSFALELAQELVGPFGYGDILHIKDLSQVIGKKHALKVEAGDDIEIDGSQTYEDLGAREIREWMAKTSVGEYKVLILENIERMTPSAANAFLKYFEEPYPRTLILATTRNRGELLDTIVSRALLIAFNYVKDDEVERLFQKKYPDMLPTKLHALVDLAGGSPGFVITLMAKDKETITDLQDSVMRFIAIHKQWPDLVGIFRLLSEMNSKGYIGVFLDTLLYHYERESNYKMINQLIQTRKRIDANVSVENALFSFALHNID